MRNLVVFVSTCCTLFFCLGGSTPFEGTEVYADYFVATDGNDQWSGKLESPNKTYTDGPFATLGRARDEVRKLKLSESNKDITVLIRGGRYYLKETVVFGLEG
jgi:hypothetical protein